MCFETETFLLALASLAVTAWDDEPCQIAFCECEYLFGVLKLLFLEVVLSREKFQSFESDYLNVLVIAKIISMS
jgi:hypothetical protein